MHTCPPGLCTGFTISIPCFNTTLSRVDRLEIAAVVEVLLALRHCPPRNVTLDVATNIRKDIVHFVRSMEFRVRQGSGALPCSLTRVRHHCISWAETSWDSRNAIQAPIDALLFHGI
jgi:hypothetical protein